MRPRHALTDTRMQAVRAHLRERLAARPEVRFAYLHGSILERATIGDVDVAVSVQPDSLPTDITAYELTLESVLERVLGLPVDVRVLEDAPLSFRHAVSRGDAVYVRDRDALARFREHTWSAYLDFAPLREGVLRDLTRRPGPASRVPSGSSTRR